MTTQSQLRCNALAGIAFLSLSALLPLARLHAQNPTLVQEAPGGPSYRAGDLLIQFKPGATDADVADIAKRGAVKRLVKHIQTDAMKAAKHPGVSLMTTDLPVRQAIEALKDHPAVEFAEPNWVYNHQTTDPYFTNNQLWGMYGDLSSPLNQYGSQAAEAWTAGHKGNHSIVIGVIDEGIQITHPDLSANVWTNPFEVDDRLDNDGNGYVDDFHGWNCIDNNNIVYTAGQDAHGTHVAGTIGAAANNIGVVGVNWNVTIISGKFLGPSGGYTIDAIQAVDYFTGLKIKHPELDIVALNNSWGGGGFSQALLDAIVRAAQQNILFVAAAGNSASNNDATAYYPARYDTTAGAGYNSVIAVAAIQSDGALASFSSYGKNSVHLGAPGVGIWSSVPTNAYASYNGTSMATPHVTGAAALYASTHLSAGAFEIRNALLGSTLPTPSLANTVTGGRLNLSTIIGAGVPPAPTGVAAIPGNAQVTLTWSLTAAAGSYEVKRSLSSEGVYATVTPVGGIAATSYVDTSVKNETNYFYLVSATNSIGSGPNSSVVSATPQVSSGPPSAPTSLAATAVLKTQIDLSWTDPGDTEQGFKIERSTTSSSNFVEIGTVVANVTAFTSTGLSGNKTYYYRVRAHNTAGNSGYSNTASAKTPRK